jgi:hypothetical protein
MFLIQARDKPAISDANTEANIEARCGACFAVAEREAASRALTVKPAIAWFLRTPDTGADRVARAGTGADLTNNLR